MCGVVGDTVEELGKKMGPDEPSSPTSNPPTAPDRSGPVNGPTTPSTPGSTDTIGGLDQATKPLQKYADNQAKEIEVNLDTLTNPPELPELAVPKVPEVIVNPKAKDADTNSAASADSKARENRIVKGRKSTLLNGGSGVTGDANVVKKSLLGQ